MSPASLSSDDEHRSQLPATDAGFDADNPLSSPPTAPLSLAKRCCLCGDPGYQELLLTCFNCRWVSIHAYCIFPIQLDVSNDWVCQDCLPPSNCEMPCEVAETSKERMVNSTNVDIPATDSSCDHFQEPQQSLCINTKKKSKKRHASQKAMNLGIQGKKMCNLHDGQGHSPSLAPKPSLKKKMKKRSHGQDAVILHDPEHIKRYKSLGNRTVLNTCYMDDEMLDALGIREDIEWMAEQVGWSQFLTMKEPTYVSLTLELLSTVKIEQPTRANLAGSGITFRLKNQNWELTIDQIRRIFGFRMGGDQSKPKHYNDKQFWSEITDELNYSPNVACSTSMYNPCFRVMHYLMANTIFGRESKSVVRSQELLLLWAMTQNHNVDTAAFLVRQLHKVGRAKKGVIVIGGLITSIARYLGVDMEGLEQACGKGKIDIHTCKLMRMIEEDNDGEYKLKLNGIDALWPLPDPTNMTVRVRENWKRTFKRGMSYDACDSDLEALLEAKQREVDEIKSKLCQIRSKSGRKG